ncbi:hypothetical protein MMC10_009784 [Thelotrema lepadinum]|nr:hypothetical protein [Thelotrema lepadinum]
MSSSFGLQQGSDLLGNLIEICFVTPDAKKTIDGLTVLGIGPFKMYTFNSATVIDFTYHGKPADECGLTVAFAQHKGLTIEIMQPDSGLSLMADFLRENGGREGIQHIAFDMGGKMSAEQRVEAMKQRGIEVAMSGRWKGKKGTCDFVFFDTLLSTGTVFETIEFSEDWEEPEDARWYPREP